MPGTRSTHGGAGFTLIEVLIASALAAAIATGIAHLIAVALDSGRKAKEQTFTAALALSKLEQLRSLPWTYEPGSDAPPMPRSDSELSPTPPGTLSANVSPYVDYLDDRGGWLGGGTSPPPRAAFVRRWSVQTAAAAPDTTLILSVLVTSVAQDHSRGGIWTARSGTETLLVTMTTRKGRQ